MNSRILLLAISAAALSSCSSVYKSGQTPDDVYYSPAQQKPAYVNTETQDQSQYHGRNDLAGSSYYSDYYLRFKSSNYYRWSTFDDYYWYDWRYNSYVYDPFYSPIYYGNYGNPYGGYTNPKYFYTTTNYSGPRMYNLNTYDNSNRQATYFNPKLGNNNNPSSKSFNTTTSTDRGGFLRSVFSNSNNGNSYYNSGNSNNGRYNGGTTRTFDSGTNSSKSGSNSSGSSSSGSRSSGGSSGGSAPVRRF